MPRRARVLAMIMAGGRGDRLQPLNRERSKSAVPFGGRHRLIDFVLSNFMNSDMPSLYVLVQYKAQSLIEHLRLAWRTSGLLPDFFVTVVPPQMRVGAAWYRGTADAVLQNLTLTDDFNADVVAVFGSDHVYRMDVNQMLSFHQEAGADATIAARPVPLADARQFGVLGVDQARRVVRFEEKPANPTPLPDDPQRALVSMRSEEHTSELQSLAYFVCRLLLEKKKNYTIHWRSTQNATRIGHLPNSASLLPTSQHRSSGTCTSRNDTTLRYAPTRALAD